MWEGTEGRDSLSSSTDVFGNVENLLSPFCYGPDTPLPTSLPGSPVVKEGLNLRGFISQDCRWGCMYNRDVIKCFPVDSNLGAGPYVAKGHVPVVISTVGYQFAGAEITCVTELAVHNQRTTVGIRKLLLGLRVKEQNKLSGALVIFDPIRAQPIKWISLTSPVSSVTVLSHFEEGGSNRPFFNEAMMTMVGVAGVGMEGGQVIIVDLGLDDPNIASSGNIPPSFDSGQRFRVSSVDPHEYLIATKRHNLVAKAVLISLQFTNEPDEEIEPNNFYYCSPNGKSLGSVVKDTVAVTSLEYFPCIGSIIVGFSFGCFQIWRVDNLNLVFSSAIPDVNTEVFGFAFQQPVDDPKNFCYLWVLYGKSSQEMHSSHAELHSLFYQDKPFTENFGYIYEDFKQCVKRLTIRFEDFFDTVGNEDDTEDENSVSSRRYLVRPLRMWTQVDNLTFFAWESSRNGVYYIGIFDLNQWYSNHTSDRIRCNPSVGLCPYWVAIPVETVDTYSTVWDVRVVPKSLERWENPHSKLDIHFYPASITFQGVCLSTSGVSTFEHFGIQEKLIRIIQKDGPTLMIDPSRFRKICQTYGLQPVFSHVYGDHLSQQVADRYNIFSVLLESRRPSLIIHMANRWLDGSFANVGCTVDLILDWVSGFCCAIRLLADEHWENLLTSRNDILSPETVHFINYSNFIWSSLLGLLTTLMRPDEVYESRSSDLDDLKFGLEKLVQYSAALLMFYKAGFLPENDNFGIISLLVDYYQRRRAEVKAAVENCDFIDPEYKQSHPLLIDYLLENFDENLLREQWKVEPGESIYPPKHVGYILNMFMWIHEDPKAIARVVSYFLMDVTNIAVDSVKLQGDFGSVMQLSSEEQSEVYHLWTLDHGCYHETILFLSQKERLHDFDDLPWCAAVLLLTALGHEDAVVELLQRSCPIKLGKIYFNLMTTSATKYSFLINDICSSALSKNEELLHHFFRVSEKAKFLGEFIKTKSRSAPPDVTEALISYLESCQTFENSDRLLSFYIHRGELNKLREQYQMMKRRVGGWNLTDDQKVVWEIRQRLVDSLLRSNEFNIVERFLRIDTPKSVPVAKPARFIKAKRAIMTPGTPTGRVHNQTGGIKLPPQLRKLVLFETSSVDPLSPLRHFAGKLHTAICNSTPKVRTAATSRLNDDALSPPETAYNSKSNTSVASGLRSPVNLVVLLKTPSVDHHKRRSSSTGVQNENIFIEGDRNKSGQMSIYSTLSGETEFNGSRSSHIQSIMKGKDSVKKRMFPKMELRFFDLSTSQELENEHSCSELDVLSESSPEIILPNQAVSNPIEARDLDLTSQSMEQDLPTERGVELDQTKNINIYKSKLDSADCDESVKPTVQVSELQKSEDAVAREPAVIMRHLDQNISDTQEKRNTLSPERMECDDEVSIDDEQISTQLDTSFESVPQIPKSTNIYSNSQMEPGFPTETDGVRQTRSFVQGGPNEFVKPAVQVPEFKKSQVIVTSEPALILTHPDESIADPEEKPQEGMEDVVETSIPLRLNQSSYFGLSTRQQDDEQGSIEPDVSCESIAEITLPNQTTDKGSDGLEINQLSQSTAQALPKERAGGSKPTENIYLPKQKSVTSFVPVGHNKSVDTTLQVAELQKSKREGDSEPTVILINPDLSISDIQGKCFKLSPKGTESEEETSISAKLNQNIMAFDSSVELEDSEISINASQRMSTQGELERISLQESNKNNNEVTSSNKELRSNEKKQSETEDAFDVPKMESQLFDMSPSQESDDQSCVELYVSCESIPEITLPEPKDACSNQISDIDSTLQNMEPDLPMERGVELDQTEKNILSKQKSESVVSVGHNGSVKPAVNVSKDTVADQAAVLLKPTDQSISDTQEESHKLSPEGISSEGETSISVKLNQNIIRFDSTDELEESELSINASRTLFPLEETEAAPSPEKKGAKKNRRISNPKKELSSKEDKASKTEDVKSSNVRKPRRKSTDRSKISELNTSVTEGDIDILPRRLTRRQKAMLESTLTDISGMGDASLKTPSHSPEKDKLRESGFEFTPPKEKRSKTGKSIDEVSVSSSEKSNASSATGRSTRSAARSRRSVTPESDASFGDNTSERRLTRSQSRKKSVTDDEDNTSELDLSTNDTSIFEISIGTPKSSTSRKGRGRRSKTPSLPPVEEDQELENPLESKASTSKVPKSSEKEPKTPVKTDEEDDDFVSGKRKRRHLRIYDYSPGLSTVLEVTESSILQATLPPTRPSRTKSKSQEKSKPQNISDAVTSSEDGVLEQPKKRSRRERNVPEEDVQDDDTNSDAQSDISVRSTRSTRSNSSRKSTGVSKIPTTTRKTRSSQK